MTHVIERKEMFEKGVLEKMILSVPTGSKEKTKVKGETLWKK